jgi:hypothetical protein
LLRWTTATTITTSLETRDYPIAERITTRNWRSHSDHIKLHDTRKPNTTIINTATPQP